MEKVIALHASFRFYYRCEDGLHFENMTVEERWPKDCELDVMKRKLWMVAIRDALEYCRYNNAEFVRIETF